MNDAAFWTIGTRPDVHSRAFASHAYWLLGREDEARNVSDQAIALARDVGHPYNLAVALAYAALLHQLAAEPARLTAAVAELRELCDRYGFAYYSEWGLILDGWSRRDGSGLELVRAGIGHLRAEGSFARMPYWLALLAEVSARVGDHENARAQLDAAIAVGHAHEDLWWLPEVLRLRARYDLPDAGERRLSAAARMAGEHGSIALLRRCERDLAGGRDPADAPTVPAGA
jgi:ATP/maltotriose-dependent transcriptional regulator MalT